MDDKENVLWNCLVERGKVLRVGKLRHRKHSKSKSNSITYTPEAVRRWIVFRAKGMTIKDAYQMTGVSWEEVNNLYRVSEECRCAIDAMYESIRMLQLEIAYSTIETYMANGKRYRKVKEALKLLNREGRL